ncbi:hypothetical protein M0812_00386 [Anaeramoeba flamelloides]|uniref:Uncharacterized protein n=1 Tax=Anaeramoeba flamelloides TaxID=1746091 RepID=A0AAV8A2A4_9EUKA|nr:hypothetical protein M0812_00386 [Anaeramoeba flamelloides]
MDSKVEEFIRLIQNKENYRILEDQSVALGLLASQEEQDAMEFLLSKLPRDYPHTEPSGILFQHARMMASVTPITNQKPPNSEDIVLEEFDNKIDENKTSNPISVLELERHEENGIPVMENNINNNNINNNNSTKAKKTVLIFFILAWGSFFTLFSISMPTLVQSYEWELINNDCNTRYTEFENEIYYHGKDSKIIKAKSIDLCKPKYIVDRKIGFFSCWVNPKNENEVKLFPDFKNSGKESATAFMIILWLVFSFPILANGDSSTFVKILKIPTIIVLFPFSSIIIPIQRAKRGDKRWILFTILSLTFLILVLNLPINRKAKLQKDRLEQRTCSVIDYKKTTSCPYCYSGYQCPFILLKGENADPNIVGKNSRYADQYSNTFLYLKLEISPETEMTSNPNFYIPYVRYPFTQYNNINILTAAPNNGDSIICYVEKGWKYSSSNTTYPEVVLQLQADTNGYTASIVFQIIFAVIYGLVMLKILLTCQ